MRSGPDIEPLDVDGVRRVLSKQPRRGSVPAAKALLDHRGRFEKDQAADRELERVRVACLPLTDRRRQRAPARVVAILDE